MRRVKRRQLPNHECYTIDGHIICYESMYWDVGFGWDHCLVKVDICGSLVEVRTKFIPPYGTPLTFTPWIYVVPLNHKVYPVQRPRLLSTLHRLYRRQNSNRWVSSADSAGIPVWDVAILTSHFSAATLRTKSITKQQQRGKHSKVKVLSLPSAWITLSGLIITRLPKSWQ